MRVPTTTTQLKCHNDPMLHYFTGKHHLAKWTVNIYIIHNFLSFWA